MKHQLMLYRKTNQRALNVCNSYQDAGHLSIRYLGLCLTDPTSENYAEAPVTPAEFHEEAVDLYNP
jgi:hypothetical protein